MTKSEVQTLAKHLEALSGDFKKAVITHGGDLHDSQVVGDHYREARDELINAYHAVRRLADRIPD